MRLVCPNCGAQYEVPAEAIPPLGRDVQCSACGHTWFEGPARPANGRPADAAPIDPAIEPSPDWTDATPRVEGDDEEADDLADLDRDEAPARPSPAPLPPRSTVTPEVAGILRAEALREATSREAEAREAEARAAEAGRALAPGLRVPEASPGSSARGPADPDPFAPDPSDPMPSAPDPSAEPWPSGPAPEAPMASRPGMAPDPQRGEEARRRMARLRGEAASGIPEPVPSILAPPAPPARRDRLPDIEEINSSLRGAPPPRPSAAPAAARGGFGLGFGGILLLAALLALLYVYAPRIAAAWPATAPVLDPYARAVDGARLWLDQRLQGALHSITAAPADPEPATADPDPADPDPAATPAPAAAP